MTHRSLSTLALAVALAACGSKESSPKPAPAATTPAAPDPTTARVPPAAPDPTAAPVPPPAAPDPTAAPVPPPAVTAASRVADLTARLDALAAQAPGEPRGKALCAELATLQTWSDELVDLPPPTGMDAEAWFGAVEENQVGWRDLAPVCADGGAFVQVDDSLRGARKRVARLASLSR